jgi:hypothetical protein
MITQKHDDDMQQGEQSVSSVVEKQTTTWSEGQSKQAPPSLPRWIAVLFSIFGIGLPLVAGSMVNWPWGGEVLDNGTVLYTVLLAMGVSVTIGVVLLYYAFRARWACWLAPLAWFVGEFVYGVIDHYALHWTQWGPGVGEHFWGFEVGFIPIMSIPLLICLVIGIAITVPIDALVRRRTARR